MKFEELSLSPNILSGLQNVDYTELTELQEQALPEILEGQDALIKAGPGESKNACFVIPALANIDAKDKIKGISALILTPNSAEAQQIDKLVSDMGYHAQIECASIDLDSSKEEQKESLRDNPHVIVGNPGPLLDTMQDLRYIFRHVDQLVIDDLAKIASLNLLPQVKKILKRVLSDHQTLIFTDEVTDEIQKFAEEVLHEATTIGFGGNTATLLNKPPKLAENLSHGYIYVPNRMKITTLMAQVEEHSNDRCVIFTASKRGTDRLYKILRKRNYKATSLHDKLSDEKRAQRFSNFTNGDVQFLLVGDISATALDLTGVKHIINYDVPKDPEEYRYRTSLVTDGEAQIISLVSKQDRSDINELESKLEYPPKELGLPKKVKQKLKDRKKKKSSQKKQNGKKKSRKKEKSKDMERPRPSYDKLSGGKAGKNKKDEKSGVISMLKNLFS